MPCGAEAGNVVPVTAVSPTSASSTVVVPPVVVPPVDGVAGV